MSELILPNIRKIFIPDEGKRIYDADLKGADAQVVAWEAEDEDLKAAFRAGLAIHEKNCEDMWGERYTKADPVPKRKLYRETKSGIHGTHYGGKPPGLAKQLGWLRSEAETFQRRWFSIHPKIKEWHKRVEMEVAATKSIANKFGQRIIFFDRSDKCFTKALAWVPQSTVATVSFKGAIAVEDHVPDVEFLLQVHDSLIFQLEPRLEESRLPLVEAHLQVPVPYDDPLLIPWSLKASDKSWGHCEKRDWEPVKYPQGQGDFSAVAMSPC